MYIFMAILEMRANICPYFKNADPLVSSAHNMHILSGSPRSAFNMNSSVLNNDDNYDISSYLTMINFQFINMFRMLCTASSFRIIYAM